MKREDDYVGSYTMSLAEVSERRLDPLPSSRPRSVGPLPRFVVTTPRLPQVIRNDREQTEGDEREPLELDTRGTLYASIRYKQGQLQLLHGSELGSGYPPCRLRGGLYCK